MKYKTQELKKDLITKRCIENDMSMDQASKQIGISKATLSRLKKSKLPDVETFDKVCSWLGTEPNKYFDKSDANSDGIKYACFQCKDSGMFSGPKQGMDDKPCDMCNLHLLEPSNDQTNEEIASSKQFYCKFRETLNCKDQCYFCKQPSNSCV